MKHTITFIGAGNMAEAIITGLINTGCPKERIFVTNKSNNERLIYMNNNYGIGVNHDREIKELIDQSEVVILAMKPKDLFPALDHLRSHLQNNQLIISVLAGTSSKQISDYLGTQNPIVRAMPNTSATVGESATGIARGANADDSHLRIAEEIFSAIGTTTIVDEEDLHLVTGLAGSGPAYIYRIVESLEQAAVTLGLEQEAAKALVRQVIVGAAEMLKDLDVDPGELRRKVTSPGGTTAAGLEALENNQLSKALFEAVKEATIRSQELGKQQY
ncbi:pyrroline-5-carboxylate reductase [Scopulibacillus cellulosilyticus]|uniref:Pyrroline-5-carboxylate reductase n=1 Tax=Scopulibacillus cellulosilyticus TaxID=2665665 RepID=A0ABW2PYH8_9BACL